MKFRLKTLAKSEKVKTTERMIEVNMSKKVALHNLGCKVNAYEVEAMQQLLEKAGYEIVPFEEGADIYLINTCTVTNIADRKSRQMLHKAKKMNPDAIVVATGCYVQTDTQKLEADSAVDLILGNNQKKQIVEALEEYEKEHTKKVKVIEINKTKEYEDLSIGYTAEHVTGLYQGAGRMQPVLYVLHHPLCERQRVQQQKALLKCWTRYGHLQQEAIRKWF